MVKIVSVKQRKKKIYVGLENGQEYALDRSDLRLFPVEEGRQVDEDEFRRFVIKQQLPSAMNLAVAVLSRRVCSRLEIIRRLESASYEEEVIGRVIEKLENGRWIDDRRFAEAWIHYRKGMHYGPGRICRELKQKGVSETIVSEAFGCGGQEEFGEEAVLSAEKMMRRCRNDPPSFSDVQKIMAALVRKGFSWDTAREAVREAVCRIKEHRGPV